MMWREQHVGLPRRWKTGEETQYCAKRLEKAEYGNVKIAENSKMAVSVSLVDPNL